MNVKLTLVDLGTLAKNCGVFKWFKFTLKPRYRIMRGNIQSAI